MIGWLARLLTGGLLTRALDSVDRHLDNQADRERLKADLIKTHLATRGDFMRAGGFWLMLIFAAPLAVWWGAVLIYSVLWCAGCAYPQDWTIAALPSPLNEWAGLIIVSIFGVVGLARLR